jgi:hypothetical protein
VQASVRAELPRRLSVSRKSLDLGVERGQAGLLRGRHCLNQSSERGAVGRHSPFGTGEIDAAAIQRARVDGGKRRQSGGERVTCGVRTACELLGGRGREPIGPRGPAEGGEDDDGEDAEASQGETACALGV